MCVSLPGRSWQDDGGAGRGRRRETKKEGDKQVLDPGDGSPPSDRRRKEPSVSTRTNVRQ